MNSHEEAVSQEAAERATVLCRAAVAAERVRIIEAILTDKVLSHEHMARIERIVKIVRGEQP